ncbi:MAG: hypothetical protein KAU22_03245, partial [Desulfuromonadales bacterium]|nr:hypothetical protein [Desulfuromonadales bacterium]
GEQIIFIHSNGSNLRLAHVGNDLFDFEYTFLETLCQLTAVLPASMLLRCGQDYNVQAKFCTYLCQSFYPDSPERQ